MSHAPAFQTVSQQLLEHAYQCVAARKDADRAKTKTYGIWCHRLPGLIYASGLAQAMAFIEDKASKSDRNGFRWLADDLATTPGLPGGNLLEAVRAMDATEYMMCTLRVVESLVFFKRFAVSVLNVESDAEPEEDPE